MKCATTSTLVRLRPPGQSAARPLPCAARPAGTARPAAAAPPPRPGPPPLHGAEAGAGLSWEPRTMSPGPGPARPATPCCFLPSTYGPLLPSARHAAARDSSPLCPTRPDSRQPGRPTWVVGCQAVQVGGPGLQAPHQRRPRLQATAARQNRQAGRKSAEERKGNSLPDPQLQTLHEKAGEPAISGTCHQPACRPPSLPPGHPASWSMMPTS